MVKGGWIWDFAVNVLVAKGIDDLFCFSFSFSRFFLRRKRDEGLQNSRVDGREVFNRVEEGKQEAKQGEGGV